jgi:hypothetical protein
VDFGAVRGHGLALRPRVPAEPGSRILRGDRAQRPRRPADPIFAHQSHEGAILERRDQRRSGGPSHGGDCTPGCQTCSNGPFTAKKPIVVIGWVAAALMGAAAVRMFIPD